MYQCFGWGDRLCNIFKLGHENKLSGSVGYENMVEKFQKRREAELMSTAEEM